MAYKIGTYAYRNRGKIRWAAGKIGRAYRRSRAKKAKFSRRNIGEPVGSGTAKRYVTETINPVNEDTRVLYQYGLTDIDQGTAINQRERRMVNLRGFKICMEVKNIATTPLYLNVAILSPKDGAADVTTSDFFRGAGANRGRDFGIGLNSNEFHCLPINSDRYTILKHKRYRLVPGNTPSDTASLNGYSYMNLDWWVPLKRQIRYDADTGQPESGKVYMVYWADNFSTAGGSAVNPAQMVVTRRVVTYFKEPKNC